MPEVTVLMTVYNGMPYLPQAVESILDQSLEDFRLVIVDDGSTDDTASFLASLDDPRIHIITQLNRGTAAAANHGLKFVETPFVARMDADDIADQDRLAKQLAFLQDHPEVGLVGAQVAPVGDHGHGRSLNLPTTHTGIFEALMTGRHGLAHSVTMMRTAVLKKIGGYWNLPLIDDWDMMLRMGEASQLANIDEVLLLYRVHSGSINGQSMWRMHREIGYSVECAKRRQSGSPPITFQEFEQQMNRLPWIVRVSERIHVHGMANYRLAIADIHGQRKLSGYLRLAYAALCSPGRTLHRMGRTVKNRWARRSQPLAPTPAVTCIMRSAIARTQSVNK